MPSVTPAFSGSWKGAAGRRRPGMCKSQLETLRGQAVSGTCSVRGLDMSARIPCSTRGKAARAHPPRQTQQQSCSAACDRVKAWYSRCWGRRASHKAFPGPPAGGPWSSCSAGAARGRSGPARRRRPGGGQRCRRTPVWCGLSTPTPRTGLHQRGPSGPEPQFYIAAENIHRHRYVWLQKCFLFNI